jgi:hypothetical protein
MFAGGSVEAGVGQHEAPHRFAPEDMRLNDLLDIGLGDVPIPHRLRVNHNVGTVLALVETARLVGTHFAFEAVFRQFLLE